MKIGLALGGGGARGLAHVTMLEVFDELGVQPDVIAGTSNRAILGAAYASGLSAAEIHSQIHELAVSGRLRDAIPRRDGRVRWLELVRFERDKGGVLSLDSIMRHLEARIPATSFEDLEIPLRVVAADFWEREEIVLESGELMAALRASMALPGVFRPAMWGDRVLIDGGAVNPVPFDLLQDDCDCVVAINVVGNRRKRAHRPPGLTAAIFNTYQVMQTSIVRQKLRHRPPTIYIQPELVDIRMLEFYKADEIFEQARPAKEQLRRSMGELLAAQSATRSRPHEHRLDALPASLPQVPSPVAAGRHDHGAGPVWRASPASRPACLARCCQRTRRRHPAPVRVSGVLRGAPADP